MNLINWDYTYYVRKVKTNIYYSYIFRDTDRDIVDLFKTHAIEAMLSAVFARLRTSIISKKCIMQA